MFISTVLLVAIKPDSIPLYLLILAVDVFYYIHYKKLENLRREAFIAGAIEHFRKKFGGNNDK